MLRFYTGIAGTGKTEEILRQIREAAEEGKKNILLIVPDQFTYEAERTLCETCGNSISMHAAAKSFSRIAMQVMQNRPEAPTLLDRGGKLLCMNLALEAVGPQLKVYGKTRRRPENQVVLVEELQELKTSCIEPEMLVRCSENCTGLLRDKLLDLALIQEAYDSIVENGHTDPSDMMTILARNIPNEYITKDSTVYLDGFTDFSQQELNVIEAMLLQGIEITVCLNMDDSDREIFETARVTKRQLEQLAEICKVKTEERQFMAQEIKNPELTFYNEHLFSYDDVHWEQNRNNNAITIYSAESPEEECELAAAKCIELVRDEGCRWRDIAVAVRGFDDYETMLDCMFRHYDVPLYMARRTNLLAKSLPTLIRSIYENITGGWDTEELLEYIRTGLSGLAPRAADILENYVIKWNLQGREWIQEEQWTRHPDGYGNEFDEDAYQRLRYINGSRMKVITPMKHLWEASQDAVTAEDHTRNLIQYLQESLLPTVLEEHSSELRKAGKTVEAEEYEQIWGILLSAMEQIISISGTLEMDAETYGKLLLQMLSQYDIGTIPVSLDSVLAGDFDRMRRRNIQHLIILGATEERLPWYSEEPGVFTQEEKEYLRSFDLNMGRFSELWLWKEYFVIYNTFTLPEKTLTLCYSRTLEGEPQEPSVVITRAQELFDVPVAPVALDELRTNAIRPVAEMAAEGFRGQSDASAAAQARMKEADPKEYEKLKRASEYRRGSLSHESVTRMYGEKLYLSPSRIDKMAGCPFSYFVQYGLKAETRQQSGITPSEIGTFMHYVLEHVARAVSEEGGFHTVKKERIRELTDQAVAEYIQDEMDGMKGQTARFRYLFGRLKENVYQVVENMAEELRESDFQPIEFELNFTQDPDLKSIRLGEEEEGLRLTGIADRIDGWEHDGKLYLRVVDYKTGRKSFDLSEVWYGQNLQMLLYLSVLWKNGQNKYGKPVEPAGVLYIPARDEIISHDGPKSEKEISRKRDSERKRSGLVLDDEAVLLAMEKPSEDHPIRFIPITINKDGKRKGSLADKEQFSLLMEHIEHTLTELTEQIREGNIDAYPWYKTAQKNACTYCDYKEICHFENGNQKDKVHFMRKMEDEEVWNRMREEAAQ